MRGEPSSNSGSSLPGIRNGPLPGESGKIAASRQEPRSRCSLFVLQVLSNRPLYFWSDQAEIERFRTASDTWAHRDSDVC